MHKPTDYPVPVDQADLASEDSPAEITYAMLRDRVEAKKPVTDEMIRIARTKLDTAHTNTPAAKTDAEPSRFKLSTITDRFR